MLQIHISPSNLADLLAAQPYEVGDCGHHRCSNRSGGFHHLHRDAKPLQAKVHTVQVWYVGSLR